MRVVRDPDGAAEPLATEVDVADGFLSKQRGLMFRRSIPDDYALVFEFDAVERRSVHMLFVPFPIDVVWTDGGAVTDLATLSPWTGLAYGRGDRIVEFPAGTVEDLRTGDRLAVEE